MWYNDLRKNVGGQEVGAGTKTSKSIRFVEAMVGRNVLQMLRYHCKTGHIRRLMPGKDPLLNVL